MKKIMWGFVMAAGVCIAAPGNGMTSGAPSGGSQPTSFQGRSQQFNGRGGSRQRGMSERRGGSERTRTRRENSGEMSESDQKLVEQINEAESMKAISRLSQSARSSRSAEVRQAMVEALERHGEDALDELVAYIADADKEVADAAFNAWAEILGGMDHNGRVQAISSAARMLGSSGMRGGSRMSEGGSRMSEGGGRRSRNSMP